MSMWRELTAVPGALKKRRLDSIDVLRSVSVLYIIAFWHLGNYISNPSYQNVVTNHLTVAALAIFVLVSGYMVSPARLGAELGRAGVVRFFTDRFVRIYPPFFFASVIFLILNLESVSIFINSILLLSMFAKPAPMTLWFITMIVLFYFAVPALVRLRGRPAMFCMASAVFMSMCYLYNLVTGWLDVRFLIYFPAFAAGVFMAGRELPRGPFLPIALSVGTAASLLLSNQAPTLEFDTDLRVMPFVLFCSSCIFVLAVTKIQHVKFSKVFHYIAYASFFMYLGHRIVFAAVKYIYFPVMPEAQIVYMLAAVAFIVVPLSFAAQCFYDNIIDGLRSRVTRSRPVSPQKS